MKITVSDRTPLNVSQREYTDEGFLKAPARTARTGIQQYLASELGISDRSPTDIVSVYRPADQVFNADSLASYDGVDITDDHPSEMVNADNYKELTVGHVSGPAVQDGDYVKANLIVKDAEAIKLVESGKAQLSAGYTAEYVNSPGTTSDGVDYEFIQSDIKINHVALVDSPRAGSMARIFDNQMENPMSKVTLDNGRAIELDEKDSALVQDSIDRLKETAKAATDAKDAIQAQLDSANEQLESLKAATSDEAIAARVAAVAKTLDSAKKIGGAEFSCDSVDPVEIKRAALELAMPKRDWSDKSAAYVEAAFDQKAEEMEDEEEKEEADKKASEDSRKALAQDMASAQDAKATVDARQAGIDSMQSAWKNTVGGAK